ncbi:hypothetical protein D3C76_992920 [compost metagenome]
MQLQLLSFDSLAQALQTLLFAVLGDAHGRVETGDATTAGLLRLIHGKVGIDDQLIGRRRFALRAIGAGADPEARAHSQGHAIDPQRCLQAVEQARGQAHAALLGKWLAHDHDKLVTADPGQQAHAGQALAKALGDADQHTVTDVMAMVVVDVLQSIEVDEHQHQLLHMGYRQGDLLLQALMQGAAVHAMGQGVVAGQVVDAPMHLQLLTDVIADPDQQLPAA